MNRHRTLRIGVASLLSAATLALVPFHSAGASTTPAVVPTGPAPAIADTAFPVPSGAVFVAPNGNDGSSGSQSAPLATIARAVQKVSAGGTIVLRGGTYRQSVHSISKRVTLQPYPHEQAWIKGSQVVSGFTSTGTTWTKTGWTSSLCSTCYPSAVASANPAAGLPDQVFFDGIQQVQVTSASAVTANTFYVDRTNHLLVLGSNPAGHVVEATVSEKAMQFDTTSAAGSVVRGLGFAQFGAHYNTDIAAMVIVNTGRMTLDSNTFAFSASRGLAIYGGQATVVNNTFAYNGYAAVLAHRADNLVFKGNTIRRSNVEHFTVGSPGSSTWGTVKITSSAYVVVQDNVLTDNDLHGIWLDISCYQFTITDNVVQRSSGHGIWVEISGFGIVASNVSTDNGGEGLRLGGANDVKVWNNTLANNATTQLYVYEDPRQATSSIDASRGITWNTANLVARNNLLVADNGTTAVLLQTWDGNSPKQASGSTMVKDQDTNAYARTNTSTQKNVVGWAVLSSPYQTNYSTMAAFASANGKDTKAWETTTGGTSLFVDEAHGNYHPSASSPVATSGTALPSDVAAAIGVPAGGTPARGAIVFAS